jgi:predicted lipoprotein with Yx(FWY)xxD motif
MTRSKSIALLAGALLLIGALIAGCGGGNDNQNPTAAAPKAAAGKTATVSAANGSLGHVLVDSQGRTLYVFKRDTGTTSMCTGACAAIWPPLGAAGKPTVEGGADAVLVGTTKRSDGTTQVTYNGHPLYRYSGDQKPGDANGQGLNTYGGRWYAVSPSGNQVTEASSSGGSSYPGNSPY